jgi:catechol 2,3-dioxygenase-like lactoylglutathione lyase family enzyme
LSLIIRVSHTSFTVADVEKSVEFYRDLLGMKLISLSERPPDFSERVTGIKGAHLKVAYLEIGGTQLELIQYLSPIGKKLDTTTCNIGSSHLAFDVDNIDEMVRSLKENGVHVVTKEPVVVPAGPNKGNRIVYLNDYDGITLEFIQRA